jgi:GT2 family glycosyltransferase
MRVIIIIVSYLNTDDVGHCVQALENAAYRDFEILICENGGAEAAARLASVLPDTLANGQQVSVIHADNPGYAGAINMCISRRPLADAWWVLNPDTRADPGALSALVERLGRGDVHAVGGVVCFPDGSIQGLGGVWRPWIARAQSLRESESGDEEEAGRCVEQRQNYLLGTSFLVGREFVQTAGPMREDYFLYGEEIEWCLRAQRRSMRLGHAPAARVIHYHGTTTGMGEGIRSRPRLPIFLDERNKILLIRDFNPLLLPISAASALVLLALRYLRRGAVAQFGYGMAGWLAGLLNKRGRPAVTRAGGR